LPRTWRRGVPFLLPVLALVCPALAGCAALTNPGVQGLPVHLLPPELRGTSQEGLKPIPLTLLGQPHPDAYRIDGGDVLGLWVEGVLGEKGQQPPVMAPVHLDNVDLPPATGFPIQVRRDGTISLPLLGSFSVRGMTFPEAEDAIGRAYIARGILKAGRERVLVSLVRPRTYHVLVLRQDSPTTTQTVVTSQLGIGGPEFVGVSRKGTGWDLVLPAYQNDVLTAIAKSGGLPGTDALDTVIVERNGRFGRGWDLIIQEYQAHGVPCPVPGGPLVSIPLRVRPGTPPGFGPEDVVLQDGDVVFIPAREERLFFTGGLLPPGEHILPRDRDLDVLEAVARVRGPMFNGAFAVSNLSGALIQPGLGQPSPSLLTVLRKLPCGGQVPIRVDLDKAVRDPRERLLVQAGDFLILQETPAQGVVRYATQTFDVPFVWKFLQTPHLFAGATFSVPGGQAPSTVAPIGFSVNSSANFTNTATTTTTGPGTSSSISTSRP
jgi:protein involved in polysaccharide export with SLBB domain